jgi:hypothetical protein
MENFLDERRGQNRVRYTYTKTMVVSDSEEVPKLTFGVLVDWWPVLGTSTKIRLALSARRHSLALVYANGLRYAYNFAWV